MEIGKLGFGMMRLPRKGVRTDIRQTSQMVDAFLEAGFSYFDTARVYPGSETATRKALVQRHPRESFQLATKLNWMLAHTAGAAHKQFETSLKKTGAGYFDYYLLHSVMSSNERSYERWEMWDLVRGLKERGLVRNWGFSFHDQPEMLDRLLTEHPDADFVQLQVNYADWENERIASRANYEVACKHGKPIVVMEPVKGGKLANPPEQVKKLLRAADPQASPASWAIRFAASLPGVLTVLSGMSNMQQMEDNLGYMREFKPLDEGEQAVIREAMRAYGNAVGIDCTACGYCVKGCSQQIPIPQVFAAANKRLGAGQAEEAAADYAAATRTGHGAADCVSCGACERVCPQHLPVIQNLRECAETFE